MKIYVAAPWIHREKAAILGAVLEQMGHKITHKWWDFELAGVDPKISNPEGEDAANCAAHDVLGVKNADLVVACMVADGGCGMFWEQGMALAWEKEVYQVNLLDGGKVPPMRSVFDNLVTRCASLSALLEKIGTSDEKELEFVNE